LVWRLVRDHWLTFLSEREAEGRHLPGYVAREFEAFLGSLSAVKCQARAEVAAEPGLLIRLSFLRLFVESSG
jgi:hypothetical protein